MLTKFQAEQHCTAHTIVILLTNKCIGPAGVKLEKLDNLIGGTYMVFALQCTINGNFVHGHVMLYPIFCK